MFHNYTLARLPIGSASGAVSYTFLPLLLLLLLTSRKESNDFLDYQQTNLLRGLAAIGIAIHHIWYWTASQASSVPSLAYTGELGVAVFLTVSGYALTRQDYMQRLSPAVSTLQNHPKFLFIIIVSLVFYCAGMVDSRWSALGVIFLVFACLACNDDDLLPLRQFLSKRILRIYPLVISIGLFTSVGSLLGHAQPLGIRPLIAAVTGVHQWFVGYIFIWYIFLILSSAAPSRWRLKLLFFLGILSGAVFALLGSQYDATFSLAFPLGVLIGNNRSVERNRWLAPVALFSLLISLATIVVLVVVPKTGAALHNIVFGHQPIRSMALFPIRLFPGVIVAFGSIGLALVLHRLRLGSPLLEYLGRHSLEIYLLNWSLFVQFDPILWRGPLSLTQWPAMLLMVLLAVALNLFTNKLVFHLKKWRLTYA